MTIKREITSIQAHTARIAQIRREMEMDRIHPEWQMGFPRGDFASMLRREAKEATR